MVKIKQKGDITNGLNDLEITDAGDIQLIIAGAIQPGLDALDVSIKGPDDRDNTEVYDLVAAAPAAALTWDELRAAHLGVGSMGETMTQLDTNVDQTLSGTEGNIRGGAETLNSLSGQIANIQNVTRLVAIIPDPLIIPDAGSVYYRIECILYDLDGNMEDPDGNEFAIEMRDAAGNDESDFWKDSAGAAAADVATAPPFPATSLKMERTAAGQYFIYYKVTAGQTEEQLVFQIRWEEGGVLFYNARTTKRSEFYTDSEIADAVWTEPLPGAFGVGSAGNIVGNRIDAAISSRATQADILADATPFNGADIDQSLSGMEDNIRGLNDRDLTEIYDFVDLIDDATDGLAAIRGHVDSTGLAQGAGSRANNVDIADLARWTADAVNVLPATGAAAVWDEDQTGHSADDSFGQIVQAIFDTKKNGDDVFFVGVGGNDAWDGLTWETRRLTLTSAYSLLGAGDLLVVGAGAYAEAFTANIAHTTIIGMGMSDGQPGSVNTFNGTTLNITATHVNVKNMGFVNSGDNTTPVIITTGGTYYTLENLLIQSTGSSAPTYTLFINGADRGHIYKCRIESRGTTAVRFRNTSQRNIMKDCEVLVVTSGALNGIIIEDVGSIGNIIRDTSVLGTGNTGTGIGILTANGSMATNCHVEGFTTTYNGVAGTYIVGCHEESQLTAGNTIEEDLAELDTEINAVHTDTWNEALPGAFGAGSAGKIVGDNLDQSLSTTEDNIRGVSNRDLTEVYDLVNGLNDPSAADNADAVWDELQAAHTLTGSFGELMEILDDHTHAPQQVFPLGAANVTLTAGAAGAWSWGAWAQIVAASTFGDVFDLHWANYSDPDTNTIYEIEFGYGAGDTHYCYDRFERLNVQDRSFSSPIQGPRIVETNRIRARCRTLAGAGETVDINCVKGHEY